MIWTWTKHAIVNNPVTFMLLLTIIIGYGYDFIPIPEGKFEHINPPEQPHSNWWVGKFMTIYLIGFIYQINRFFPVISQLDKDVMSVYFCIDFLGFISYFYQGWPEPKALFIFIYCLGVVTVIFLTLWRSHR
jgi:hypothetical protein